MVYFVEFIIDNGCREDGHITFVKAENTGEAMFKFNQYIDSKLKHDEVVTQATFTTIKENAVFYCNYK